MLRVTDGFKMEVGLNEGLTLSTSLFAGVKDRLTMRSGRTLRRP